ncbi:MAG: UDP-2,3-diacylglucosamine diphosphatase LpxI [Alphaproteobacteria bacterium]
MSADSQSQTQPLGIIAAGGTIPGAVAEAALAKGHAVHVVALRGQADPAMERFPHNWVRIGQVGHILGSLRRAGCRDVVIVGSLRRPNIWRTGMDWGLIRHFPTLWGLTRGGDDSILRRVVRFFEGQGFTVRGAHEYAPSLLAPLGALGAVQPTAEHESDIARGQALLRATAQFDVGQAVVVARGYVLAVEAAEGTDEMLKRCGGLRQWGRKGRSGVLVKLPKAGQEMRVDMPAIGANTVENVAAAGLAGIAVASGQVIVADLEETVRLADKHGVFVVGIDTA